MYAASSVDPPPHWSSVPCSENVTELPAGSEQAGPDVVVTEPLVGLHDAPPSALKPTMLMGCEPLQGL